MTINYLWTDYRIIDDTCSGPIPDFKTDQIFKPNLNFLSLKELKFVPSLDSQTIGYFGVTEGFLWRQISVQLTLYCEMTFENYPMDTQTCRLRIINPDFGQTHLLFLTTEHKVNERVPQRLLPFEISYEEMKDEEKILYQNGQNKSVAGFNVLFERRKVFNKNIIELSINIIFFLFRFLPYALNIYLPTTILVIVSWASFLINPEIIPGRMGLLVTIYLVLTNLSTGARAKAPPTGSITYVDAWFQV